MAKRQHKRLSRFHWHEALDRSMLVFEFFQERVAEHPAIQADKQLKTRSERAGELLFEIYQMVGAKSLRHD